MASEQNIEGLNAAKEAFDARWQANVEAEREERADPVQIDFDDTGDTVLPPSDVMLRNMLAGLRDIAELACARGAIGDVDCQAVRDASQRIEAVLGAIQLEQLSAITDELREQALAESPAR